MIPARLSDNHATIDLARTLFDFDAPGFWDLVYTLRLDIIDAAAKSDLPYFVTTACYGHPDDLAVVETWEAVLKRHDAQLIPVHLTCTPAILAQQVIQPDRAVRKKMNSVNGLEKYLAKNNFLPLPRPGCVTIDTGTLTPESAAKQIVRDCRLVTV